ncbi:hypothetical protein LP421_06850 [Rhizobium sp. RCAM05350]|nr:hypothetical protein LP421_06850 [Rhizobium sp. RCAM05350]
MTGIQSSAIDTTEVSFSTEVDIFVANPALFPVLQQGARHMIELYDHFPRIARLVAAQQKWLLTQAAYALHVQRDPADPLSGITASRLLDLIAKTGLASRNTATAFLAELRAYKLVRDVAGSPSKRSRPLEPTETSHEAMTLWFRGQLRSLDLLDNGNRVARLEANPDIFRRAQPLAAKRLISDPAWREPPLSISCFVWTEYGGLILDDFISADCQRRTGEWLPLGRGPAVCRTLQPLFTLAHACPPPVRACRSAGLTRLAGPQWQPKQDLGNDIVCGGLQALAVRQVLRPRVGLRRGS